MTYTIRSCIKQVIINSTCYALEGNHQYLLNHDKNKQVNKTFK